MLMNRLFLLLSCLTVATVFGQIPIGGSAPTTTPQQNNAAKKWFVAEDGRDGNTGLARDQPFKSLAFAVKKANSGDTIFLLPGTFDAMSCGTVIDKDLTITSEGGDPERTMIDCSMSQKFGIQVSGIPHPKVTLTAFTLKHASASAIVLDNGNTTITHVHLVENEGIKGGGIFVNQYARATIQKTDLIKNNAKVGGAIFAHHPALLVIEANTRIMSNTADTHGGGVYQTGGLLYLKTGKWIMENNVAKGGDGGGMYLQDVNAIIGNGPLRFNMAKGNGGGIAATGESDLTIYQVEMLQSHAAADGGGIYLNGGALNIRHSDFREGTADNGGAIFLTNGAHFNSASNTYQNNVANSAGGALYVKDSAILDSEDGSETFQLNTASTGGALYIEGSTITSFKAAIQNNTANNHGGGMWIKDSIVHYKWASVEMNFASMGGGVYCDNSKIMLEESDVGINYAQNLICMENCKFTCRHCRPCTCDDCDDQLVQRKP